MINAEEATTSQEKEQLKKLVFFVRKYLTPILTKSSIAVQNVEENKTSWIVKKTIPCWQDLANTVRKTLLPNKEMGGFVHKNADTMLGEAYPKII